MSGRLVEMDTYVPVAEFYSGRSIFITGGTGFLGMILIEKLLYSCPDVGNIYILVREKKGVSAKERIRKILDSTVFERLKKEKPENLKKVIPVIGELTETNLGINAKDLETIRNEVSVVFHLAATIKFNEPLSVAMKINVGGTTEVLKLGQSMKNMEVFVYMSTIFSNTDHERNSIEEKLYPIPKELKEVYKMIEENDPKEVFSPDVLDGRPNTYTFTKSLAEHVVANNRGDMPTVIIRPSVVTPVKDDPVRGWIANWMGPTPILTLLAKGWMRSMYGDETYTFEIIPVDYVVNLTIIAAAKHNRSKDLPIYHSCSSSLNPITLNDAATYYINESCRQGFNELPWPGMIFTKSLWLMAIFSFFLQMVPAYIADFLLYISGKPIRYIKTQRKISVSVDTLKYFASRSWYMLATRSQALYGSLSKNDQKLFPCDPTQIRWDEYMSTYFNGVKRFLLRSE